MQAIEATGTVNAQGQISLDQPLQIAHPARVRVIVLLSNPETSNLESSQPKEDGVETIEPQDVSAQSFLSMVDTIRSQVPKEEWKKLPTDLSKNIDHYLYGSAKIEE
ncbi:MAG: hypothetical protein MUF49_08690 [Oculatellaceae cyanobacterium Prado106]|jgi:hypothetical protein|nr:hypothetical protein [Oculatellaceae cyanobacterium Prado106]